MSKALVGGGVSHVADLILGATEHKHHYPELGTMHIGPNNWLYLMPDSMSATGKQIPPASQVQGGYVLVYALTQDSYTTEAVSPGSTDTGGSPGHTHGISATHDHQYPNLGLQDGDRVFICWTGPVQPVVVGKVV